MKKVKRSWVNFRWKGKESGKRNVIAIEPYTRWVVERVQVIYMFFIFDSSIFPQVSEPGPILPEEVEDLKAKIQRLELENSKL